MGKSIDQILSDLTAQAGDGGTGRVFLSLSTHQDNHISTYAQGLGSFTPGDLDRAVAVLGGSPTPAHIFTQPDAPLLYYFSDRKLNIDGPPPQGMLGREERQLFSANAADKIGVSLSQSLHVQDRGKGKWIATFTLYTWGNHQFKVPLEQMGNVLVGIGEAVGNQTDQALYSIAFQEFDPR